MLTKQECYDIFKEKVNELFGDNYILENKSFLMFAATDEAYEGKYTFFIANEKDFPNLKANYKGWKVYIQAKVDQNSGEIDVEDYQSEKTE
ncbi:MAG: hypothetical protein KBT03_07605 [Bacteroidales bacterium]|nr:hypothetical protein [Candidatus Scybalousia scybalohippi]